MKKIALLMAVLLVLGLFAGCNAEKEKTPDHVVPGYSINLYTGEGWAKAEETSYDLQLSKDGVTLYVRGYTLMDFVDMPPMEDLFLDDIQSLQEGLTDISVKEKQTSYEVDGRTIVSTLFSAKEGEETKQFYCFGIDFTDEAGSVAFLCFSAGEKTMKKQKTNLKKIADQMDANGEYISEEEFFELLEDAQYEDGSETLTPDDLEELDPTPTEEGESYTEPTYEGSAG